MNAHNNFQDLALLELRAVPMACCVHASLVMKVPTAVTVRLDTSNQQTAHVKVCYKLNNYITIVVLYYVSVVMSHLT